MAKNKRPKWLDAETPELLNTLKEILAAEEITDKDQAKAAKIADELISRLPSEDAAPLSVTEAIAAAKACMDAALDVVKAAYDNEVAIIADTEPEEEPEEEEAPAPKKKDKKKDKKSKKAVKVEEPEEEDDSEDDDSAEEDEEDDDDDSAEDYSDWSTKDLKKECRERGIKVTKSMGKAELVKALEADDKE